MYNESFLLKNISKPPRLGKLLEEKYKVLPSICKKGDLSSPELLITGPKLTGSDH